MTPWLDYMALGVGLLGVRPGDFWRMTPQEFQALVNTHFEAMRQHSGGAAPLREELCAMMARFPDQIR